MVFLAVDIETQGLDSTKYLLGGLLLEGWKEPEFFTQKEFLWSRIVELGESLKKRGKKLQVYAHNAQYDFYGYAPIESKNLAYVSLKPFIVKYFNNERKEIIEFLDTMSFYPIALKEVGTMLGMPKMETPQELIDGTCTDIEKIKPYLAQDLRITLAAMVHFKKTFRGGKIPRYMYTISQQSIEALLDDVVKEKEAPYIFEDTSRKRTFKTKYASIIHGAYRMGMLEAWQTGIIADTTAIDCNSLYPYMLATMPIPNLKTEKKIWHPLDILSSEKLYAHTGVALCCMKNVSCEVPFLQVRTSHGSITFKKGQIAIGHWTLPEIQYAQTCGYQLLAMPYAVLYDILPNNPFRNSILKTYAQRKQATDPLQKYLLKQKIEFIHWQDGTT